VESASAEAPREGALVLNFLARNRKAAASVTIMSPDTVRLVVLVFDESALQFSMLVRIISIWHFVTAIKILKTKTRSCGRIGPNVSQRVDRW
jgi:hypothetical protein